MIRLDRALSEHTLFSRSQIKGRIRLGQVTVNGVTITDPAAKVDPAADQISMDGAALDCSFVYLMLNKPGGVICATRDNHRRTVIDLVPPELRRKGLFAAGRLDIDTEGFVLLTDDGAFAHRMLSPRNHVEKAYIARISGAVDSHTAERFAQGLALEDGSVCRPARFERLTDGDPFQARIVLCEGMFHQVKRMAACCGGQVTALRRERIGGLELDERLKPGGCRALTRGEVRKILGEGE